MILNLLHWLGIFRFILGFEAILGCKWLGKCKVRIDRWFYWFFIFFDC